MTATPTRARLLHEYTAERIADANAADYVRQPYREGFPSRERVAEWNREWLELEAKERAAVVAADRPSYEELETNAATQAHINLVRVFLRRAATELLRRGEIHDLSKFSPEEVKVFTEFTPKLRGSTYGSEEYRTFLLDMGPALEHHYAANRHHPEHFADGLSGMNLFDVLEMFIDWLASGKRHADGDIMRSIEINQKRFGMSEQLVSIFQNTARDFDGSKKEGSDA